MKLALTGGVAEGKSTVAAYVREAGFEVASADEIAREVFLDPNIQEGLAAMLGVRPPVEPAVLRTAIFANPALRRQTNRLMHPRILQGILSSPAPVVEAPLLFEACIHSHFDRIWVVTCGPLEQLKRLAERLGNEGEARAIITAQLPTRVKCSFADRIVRTNAPSESVRSYVLEMIGRDLLPSLA